MYRPIKRHGYAKTNFLTLLTLGWYGVFAYAQIVKDVNSMSEAVFGRGMYRDITFSKAVGFLICPFVGGFYIVCGIFAIVKMGIITPPNEDIFITFVLLWVVTIFIAFLALLYVVWIKGGEITHRMSTIVRELGADRLGYNNYVYLELLGRSSGEKARFDLFNVLAGYFERSYYE